VVLHEPPSHLERYPVTPDTLAALGEKTIQVWGAFFVLKFANLKNTKA